MAKSPSGAKLTSSSVGSSVGPKEPIIDDSNWKQHIGVFINGETKGHGLVPRDYTVYPREMFDAPSDVVIVPKSEWSDRIKEMEATKSRVSDVLLDQGIPSMDQGQYGYCWSHSITGVMQAIRALANQAYVPLSAFAVAATIKKGRNEGGWCGLSGQFARERGIPSQKRWPQGDASYQKYDTPETWADAAQHKSLEEWVDLAAQVYDQNLADEIEMSLLLARRPFAGDFNWWSHSVLICDPVEVEPGSFGKRLRNSWTDSYGDKGFAVLRGDKARTDGALCIRATGVSPN